MSGESQAIILPDDIAAALAASPNAEAAFAKMPPSHRKRWIDHIDEAKKPETRASRVVKMIEELQKT